MTLSVVSTEIEDYDNNTLVINGGKRRLYIRGEGFLTCGFELDVVVINSAGNGVEDGRIKTYIDKDDISEKEMSVIIEAIDKYSQNKLATGNRTVAVKKKLAFNWAVGICVQNDANDNINCAEITPGIVLAR